MGKRETFYRFSEQCWSRERGLLPCFAFLFVFQIMHGQAQHEQTSFRNCSTKLSEGHNWPGRSLHRRWRICGALSTSCKGPNLAGVLNMQTCEDCLVTWSLGTSFRAYNTTNTEKVCIAWILLTGGHLEGQRQHFMGGWCITATNGGAASFCARLQDIARSLAWSVCVIETDRRWRCLADWNGWTFFNFIQLHLKDSRTARVIVQPKTGPFAARACYIPSSREFEGGIDDN